MRRKFEINLLFTFNDSVFVPPTKLYRIIKYVALPCRAPFSLICSGFLNFPCSPLKLRSSSSNTLKTKSHWSKSEVSCRILDFIKHGQDKEALKLMKTAEHCGIKFPVDFSVKPRNVFYSFYYCSFRYECWYSSLEIN